LRRGGCAQVGRRSGTGRTTATDNTAGLALAQQRQAELRLERGDLLPQLSLHAQQRVRNALPRRAPLDHRPPLGDPASASEREIVAQRRQPFELPLEQVGIDRDRVHRRDRASPGTTAVGAEALRRLHGAHSARRNGQKKVAEVSGSDAE
jgi:hypothetical protein